MSILNKQDQRRLLAIKGIKRMTRQSLAKSLGISLPTVTKILKSDTPLVIQSETYNKVLDFIKSNEVSIRL